MLPAIWRVVAPPVAWPMRVSAAARFCSGVISALGRSRSTRPMAAALPGDTVPARAASRTAGSAVIWEAWCTSPLASEEDRPSVVAR